MKAKHFFGALAASVMAVQTPWSRSGSGPRRTGIPSASRPLRAMSAKGPVPMAPP